MALSPRDRRALIVAGVVAVAAALLFVFVLNRGPSTPTATQLPRNAVGPAPTSPSPAPAPAKRKPREVLVFSGRDPFDPRQGGGALVNTSTTGPSVSPAGNPSSGPTGGSSTTVGSDTVVLVDVFTSSGQEQAQVEVDGTVYTVGEGDTFAGSYKLVSITGSCAKFEKGTQTFTLCEVANK